MTDGGLEILVMDPARVEDGAPVVVLLHGRGADPSDLAGLRPWLPDRSALVLPRAPFPAAEWGYGPGWAWYRYAGDDRPDEESFRAAQDALDELLEDLPSLLGYRPGAVVLGGFSQGGTMSIGHALRRPGAVAGVLNFSGFVPRHSDVPVTPDSVRGAAFFWGHGLQDPAIPFALAERGRAALAGAGAELEARDYPIGHAIAPEELRDAMAWLGRVISARVSSRG
jgi:phospholipase/carboxylesterase